MHRWLLESVGVQRSPQLGGSSHPRPSPWTFSRGPGFLCLHYGNSNVNLSITIMQLWLHWMKIIPMKRLHGVKFIPMNNCLYRKLHNFIFLKNWHFQCMATCGCVKARRSSKGHSNIPVEAQCRHSFRPRAELEKHSATCNTCIDSWKILRLEFHANPINPQKMFWIQESVITGLDWTTGVTFDPKFYLKNPCI